MMSKKRKTTELFWTEKKMAEIKMFYVFMYSLTLKLNAPLFNIPVSASVSALLKSPTIFKWTYLQDKWFFNA